MQTETVTLTAHDYQNAIRVQSAVNLSGVLRSAHEVQHRIRASDPTAGTQSWNQHPIMVMYACAILELARAGLGDGLAFSRAYDACRAECERAGLDPEG